MREESSTSSSGTRVKQGGPGKVELGSSRGRQQPGWQPAHLCRVETQVVHERLQPQRLVAHVHKHIIAACSQPGTGSG